MNTQVIVIVRVLTSTKASLSNKYLSVKCFALLGKAPYIMP